MIQREGTKETTETKESARTAESTPPPHLGERIRRLRVREGKSLRQLATELDVSASALSMLENNQTGVSLSRLQLIAEHFGVSIVDLLAEPSVQSDKESADAVEIIRNCASSIRGIERGSRVTYQIPALHPKRLLQPALLSFPPGSGFLNDKIAHQGEELAYVLLGEVELHHGEHVRTVAQGDLAVFRSDTPHAFHNPTEGPAMVFAVAAPPW